MATLEKIRRRSGMLIIVIGLAMMAFILTDLLSSGGSLLNGDLNVVGKINDREINQQEFAQLMEVGTENYKNSSRDYNLNQITTKQLVDVVWDEEVRSTLFDSQYEELGISITADELFDQIISNPNITSIQAFRDPNTGQFSEVMFKTQLQNLKDQAGSNPQAATEWQNWVAFENQVRKQAYTFKYNDAIEKGLYFPTRLAQLETERGNTSVTANFIQLPFGMIQDQEVEVTDADKEKYYQAHKSDFKVEEETRTIQFVNFPIQASAEDNLAVKEELEKLIEPTVVYNSEIDVYDTIPGFKNAESDSLFVNLNSDRPFNRTYLKQGELNPSIDSIMFTQTPGYIHGPYIDNNGYAISKLVNTKNLPDSVNARHILIAFQGAERAAQNVTRTPQDAKTLADSLFAVLKEDINQFDTISKQYSNDAIAALKGGDLGWFKSGAMTPQFNDFCFYNEKGSLGLVFTNFGFHIIEIKDQGGSNKAVQVATIFREIQPSEATLEGIYQTASTFASEAKQSEDYTVLAEEKGYALRRAVDLKNFDENIPGLGFNRKIVRWAFDEKTEQGGIQLIENGIESYVVVILEDIVSGPYKSLDQVDEEVTIAVIQEKKAEILSKQFEEAMASNDDFEAIAKAVNQTPRQQITNPNMAALTGAGNEPKVVGMMNGVKSQVNVGPVVGNMGVYVFRVASVDAAPASADYKSIKESNQQMLSSRVASQVFLSLKEGADVEDNRARFY